MTHDALPSLNNLFVPAQGKCLGCQSCKLFQYAPSPFFKRKDRDEFLATLDPKRFEKKNDSYRMSPDGPEDADVLVVLDWPTKVEDADGTSFSGAGCRVVRRNAKEVGLDPSAWRWSYMVRCRPPEDKLSLTAATYCTGFLAAEIQRLRPKTIIAFGDFSLKAILGKDDASIQHFVCQPQDAVVAGHTCVVYPMQAPWFILKNDYLAEKYLAHFQKLAGYLRGDTGVAHDTSKKTTITDVDHAIAVCQHLVTNGVEKGKTIEADLETSGLLPYKQGQRISIVSLGCSIKNGYAITYNHDEKPWTDKERRRFVRLGLKPLLQHPEAKIRWHNGKFDVKWVVQHMGFWPRDQIEDTMLTHYAVDENVEHGLKPLALMYTDMGDYDAELDDYLRHQDVPDAPRYDLVPHELLCKYASMDVIATRKLARALKPEVDAQSEFVHALAYRAMPAFSATLTQVEHNGVTIDTEITKNKIIPFLTAEAEKSYDLIMSEPTVRQFIRDGEAAHRAKMKRPKPIEVKQYFEFSLSSPKQLKTLLYDERYYNHTPTVFSEKTKEPSTDKEALGDLALLGSPIAKAIMDHRLDEKMVSAFGQPILDRLAAQGDNLLHGDLLLHGTKTGRLSGRNPNLQNQPNKGNGIIKRMFVSRYGADGVFIQVDFSQIELRVLAALSNDPKLVQVYLDGGDIHTLNACMIFNMTIDEMKALPDAEQKRRRTVAKRVGFGISYGIGAPGIQSTLKSDGVSVSEEEARGYLEGFAEKYPDVMAWIASVEASTTDDAHALSAFGRRRRLESVRSQVDDVVARALRQGVNHAVQSTAGDMTMTALCLIDQEIRLRRGDDPRLVLPTVDTRDFPVDERWARVHPILQVHDMIGIDAHRDVAGEALDRLVYTMQNVVDMAPLVWGDCVRSTLAPLKRVPIVAEPEVGPNWRDAVKVKSGKDVPAAMFVACAKRDRLDKDMMYEWSKSDASAAMAEYEKQKAA
jgi:uracil-DNA glycosylase family 4